MSLKTILLLAAVWGLTACEHPSNQLGVKSVPSTATPSSSPSGTTVVPFDNTAEFAAELGLQLRQLEKSGYAGTVLVEQGHQVLFAQGYGYANRRARVRFTPDTVAQIASVTKSQTGAAVAALIAKGQVALSDPVAKFVPEAPEPGRSRTIAQLLTHSSGLADICTDDFVHQSEETLVTQCLARPLAYAVGEDNYSNLGYSTLGLVTQRVTGKPWEEAVRQLVWEPMGITGIASQFPEVPEKEIARGYLAGVEHPELSAQLRKLNTDDWALRGNGSLSASTRSMIRYIDAVVDGSTAYPAAATALLRQPVTGQVGAVREGFGMVMRYDQAGAMTRMGHSGSDGVFLSYLGWLPKNDVRFYFIGNNGEDEAQKALTAVIRTLARIPPAAT